MREKLLNLMKSEGLTSSRLAELLGIQPSGISHILSGRNKPSFDLVQKILRRFPRINPDWLLLDSGPMFRDRQPQPANGTESTAATSTLFTDTVRHSAEAAQTALASNESEQQDATPMRGADEVVATASEHGKVKRIIVLFEDHTFESYDAHERK